MPETQEQTVAAIPPHVICRDFFTSGVSPRDQILDVGCGEGDLMTHLTALGCNVIGTEIDRGLIEGCRRRGLDVREGWAQDLPFPDNAFDCIVCSVVVPYTDERRAVAEWARVLKPGGRVLATYHGVGYGFYYILKGEDIRARIYGLRMLANTCWYHWTGRRLPGFLGDTLCQGKKRLASYYNALGFNLERELAAGSVGRFPRFLCHQLVKQRRTAGTDREDTPRLDRAHRESPVESEP